MKSIFIILTRKNVAQVEFSSKKYVLSEQSKACDFPSYSMNPVKVAILQYHFYEWIFEMEI